MIKAFLKKWLARAVFPHLRSSYSQSGEDIILCDLFSRLGIDRPSYLDIGANEPVALSNTYRLYKRGSRGVCLEPNPRLYRKFLSKRKGDTVLNAGVAFDNRTEADYYLFEGNAHGFSTFSKADADFWVHTGNEKVGRFKIESVIRTPLLSINEILQKHFPSHPNLISIDVEGLDLQILKMIDFSSCQIEVICVETLVYKENNKETKNDELINFLKEAGYFRYADTYINTIFCRKEAYKAFDRND
ncbi:MAG: FkbM family methyltransferase [Sphingobacteriales bacterium]|nr:FkbM family methyltransferase [Sphingobacteriales bacterium]